MQTPECRLSVCFFTIHATPPLKVGKSLCIILFCLPPVSESSSEVEPVFYS